MNKQIIECVPNISEGRDLEKIKIISEVVEKINGVKLLIQVKQQIELITFVGEPEQVVEAATLKKLKNL